MGPSGGGSSQQTVTQTQQIPEFEQQFAQENQDLARSLGSQPYPVYQGQMVAGFTPAQQQGQQQAINAANSYQPALNAGMNATQAALGQNPLQGVMPLLGQAASNMARAGQVNAYGASAPMITAGANDIQQSIRAAAPYMMAGTNMIGHAAAQNPLAGNPANPGVINSYMNPYISAALQPQLDQMRTELGLQQRGIDARATQAGAFGDARQAVAEALANKNANLAMGNLVANGFNTGYNNALNTALQQEGLGIQEQQFGANAGNMLAQLGLARQGANTASGQALAGTGQVLGNQAAQQAGLLNQSGQGIGQLGLATAGAGMQGQQIGMQGGQQLANLGGLAQQLGLGGANAIYNVGSQQQQLDQQMLNTAYQQFQNQVNWPYQQLNVRLSALSNSPYNITNTTTLPQANMEASNLGALGAVAGGIGSLFSPSGSQAPFGGYSYNAAQARTA